MTARVGPNAVASRSGVRDTQRGISSEDLLAPEIVLPEQFHALWHRTRTVTPERALAIAVLSEALHDLVRFRFAKGRRAQRLYWEAYAWVTDEDRTWPFSFVNLCEGVGVTVEAARSQVLAIAPAATEANVAVEAILEKAA